MKKNHIIPGIYFFLLLSCICYSCKKADPVTGPGSFSWTINSSTTTASWDSAFVRSMGTTPLIMAGKGSGGSITNPQLVISIASFNIAMYSIGSGNEIEYIDDAGNTYFGISGTVNITAYSNSRLSGLFSASLAGPSGSFSITGEFANVPVAP